MPVIHYRGQKVNVNCDENLLDGLLRHSVRVPFSCRSGYCHSCLLKVDKGKPPLDGQKNLTQNEIDQNLILACQSQVEANLDLSLPARQKTPAVIALIEHLDSTSIKLSLSLRHPLAPQPESQIKLISPEGQEHSVNVTTVLMKGKNLEMIVKRKAGDAFTAWLYQQAKTGHHLMLTLKTKP
ncbi:MAG: 2Fe-2S iron-sulfur cluster-binding protein [Endozoicomonas sp.]